MPTYIIDREIAITRQEADTADVVFTVPDLLDMSRFSEVRFQVANSMRSNVLKKSLTEGSLSLQGQVITVPLQSADTKGKSGKFKWELEISNATEVITIGRGDFIVVPQQIR